MFDRDQLAALSAILRTGSFEGGAAALHVTPSAVSQRIRALEERAGAALLVRSHPVAATAAGARLARHAEAVALAEAATLADLGLTAGPVPVRIAVNADSLATWVLPALAEGAGLLFDVVIDDQDHSADLLRRGEVVAGITASDTAVRGCDAFPLGALRYVATASPAFVRRHCPEGIAPGALAAAPALTFNLKDRLQRDWLAEWAGRGVALQSHLLPSSEAFVAATLLGLGWSMNPEALVRDHLAAGRLVDLRPGAGLDVPLTWQVSRLVADALRPLTASIRAAARAALVAGPAGAAGVGHGNLGRTEVRGHARRGK
jgi:LysR family transcriptional regulator (chromosome initiation inhibitor)